MSLIHGTCVELSGVAVLLRGAPGSGKSDLALRLIERGARLIADDGVEIVAEAGALIAAPAAAIAGRLEVRGLGIVELPWLARGRLGLVVDLVAPSEVARLPEAMVWYHEGIDVPRLALAPFEASTAAKIAVAVRSRRQRQGSAP